LLCARSHGGHGQALGGRWNFSTLKGRVGIMNKATMKWRLALPVAAAVLALGGCGGSDDSTDAVVSSSGSITACFTANSTVSFSYTTTSNQLPNRSTVGPMTYNGQAVTGQIAFYPSGTITAFTSYWTVASNGVTQIASVINNSTVELDGTFLPQNMNPGQAATGSNNNVSTFLGFQTITLAGKTFANTCHFNIKDNTGTTEQWYAPGYGVIQQVGATGTVQYNGDL
jgi:hypothetical protein